jgi:hypothetical protein
MGAWSTRAAWLFAATAVAMMAPAVARADSAADAKDLFGRARDLRVHGDCARAAPLFRRAYEIYPQGLGSLRNLAECQEVLGQFASARHTWLDLKQALLGNADAKYQGWPGDADQAAARLQAKVSTMVVDLQVVGSNGEPVSPDGVDVTIDGQRVDRTLVGAPIENDAGHHTVRAAGDRLVAAVERAVDLTPGESQRVELRATVPTPLAPPVVEAPVPVAPSPVEAPPPAPRDDRGRAFRRGAGWVAIGMGAAGVVGSAISLGVRQAAESTLSKDCPSYHTGCSQSLQPTLQPTVNTGHIASTMFTVLGVVGVVGLAGGIVLLATTPSRPVQAAVMVHPGGISVGGEFE